MAEKLEGSASTNVYRCSKCGLPSETLLTGPGVRASLCCKAPVKVEAGR